MGMGDGRGPGRSTNSAAGLAVVVTVGIALVVLAASTGSSDGSPDVRPPDLVVLVWLLIAGLLGFGTYVVVSIVRTLERGELRHDAGKTIFDVITLIVFIAMVIVLLKLLPRDEADTQPPPTAGDQVTETVPLPDDSRGDWATLAVIAGVAAFIGWRAWRRRSQLRLPPDVDRRLAADVVLALDDAIAALRTEPDARRAIIAAYARMEDVFAQHELPRRPSEAPLEFLARALEQVTATEPARRLTDLFERAMFSTQRFDRPAQLEAVDALQAVRDDLVAGARS